MQIKRCKSRDSNLYIHFKKTCETVQAIKSMHIHQKATKYWKDELDRNNVCHSTATMVAKNCQVCPGQTVGLDIGLVAQNSTEFLSHMLKNEQSNAELKGLNVLSLVIEHIQINKAPKMWQRTYRAHGQTNPRVNSPCNTEVIFTEKKQTVPKSEEVGCTEEKDTPK